MNDPICVCLFSSYRTVINVRRSSRRTNSRFCDFPTCLTEKAHAQTTTNNHTQPQTTRLVSFLPHGCAHILINLEMNFEDLNKSVHVHKNRFSIVSLICFRLRKRVLYPHLYIHSLTHSSTRSIP